MPNNYRQRYAIEKKNKQRILDVNCNIPDTSGIYFLTRKDENDIKYAYIGQAKHILTRLAQHLVGYQHIDLSMKKHGLYSGDNLYGWDINFLTFAEKDLDEKEQHYIKLYAQNGYQLRNKTAGGQGAGKVQIDEYRPSKGYRDGLEQGRKNASREIAHLFDLHLVATPKSDKPTVNQLKAMDKFNAFLNYYKEKQDG